jgi:hypothetical protein
MFGIDLPSYANVYDAIIDWDEDIWGPIADFLKWVRVCDADDLVCFFDRIRMLDKAAGELADIRTQAQCV